MKASERGQLSFPLRCAVALSLATASFAADVQAQTPPQVAPGHLSSYWILLNRKIDVDVPGSGRNLDHPGCVAVSYLVGSDGVPRRLKVRKVVPASDLGSAALSAVSQFRYGPSLANHEEAPVSTYYVVAFNAPDDPGKRQQLMAACRLPGYSP